ncbi:MAG: hypothetical protein UY63_C0018G0029 [Parcubacteria group bacterium GW2011_GWA2_51_10]|nr:MAG: hypothetical protein UY63_C0018G0029 [Parcubacteria group bacterium GW2011_GWA2_51_10]
MTQWEIALRKLQQAELEALEKIPNLSIASDNLAACADALVAVPKEGIEVDAEDYITAGIRHLEVKDLLERRIAGSQNIKTYVSPDDTLMEEVPSDFLP